MGFWWQRKLHSRPSLFGTTAFRNNSAGQPFGNKVVGVFCDHKFVCWMLHWEYVNRVEQVARKKTPLLDFICLKLESSKKYEKRNTFQLLPSDLLISQMEVTFHPFSKVTNKTPKFGSLGRTRFMNLTFQNLPRFHGMNKNVCILTIQNDIRLNQQDISFKGLCNIVYIYI